MSTRAPSGRLQAGLAMALSCLLGACQTVDRPSYDDASLRYTVAPRSALVERQDLQFGLAQMEREAKDMVVLAYGAPGSKPLPVSLITSSGSGARKRVSVQRYPLPETRKEGDDVDVATLEYLYTLVIRQDPEGQFCFADIGQRCDADGKAYSHAEILLQLARSRQHAVGTVKDPGSYIPWRVVSLAPAETPHTNPDDVSVRVTGERGPTKDVTIFFNRAPHSSCAAKSAGDGVAACRLLDQHGDDDSHAGQDRTPVLATFPGDIQAKSVLLPTTLIVQPPSR
nr:hypothetical protein [Massilia sp. JS1662]